MSDLLSALWSSSEPPALSEHEWELLLAQARATRLAARLALLYLDRNWMATVPERPARHLESARRFADRLQHEVLWEVDHIALALRPLDTPIVLLKGAAYLATGLPPSRGRLFSDVDVMVSRDRLAEVEQALFAAGWIAEKLTPYDDRYYRTWMHELPPLQHVQRRTQLDVHHTIAPPTSRFAVDGDRLLERRVPLPGDLRLSALQPTDMVLHSAIHLMQEGDFSGGLRDLLDINDLLLHFGSSDAFWPDLIARAFELQLTTPLFHVLTQVDRLFGTRPPADQRAVASSMAPAALSRWLISSLLTIALRPAHATCDGAFTAPARWLLYVRSHWLRMPWYQIAPHLIRKAVMRAVARPDPPSPEAKPPQRVAGPAP